jgi:hypothetical protein
MPRRYALWGTLVPAILITLALGLSLRPPSLRAADRVQGDMGIVVSDLSPEACRAAGVTQGVLVIEVVPGGPADRKGIVEGDIITEYENQPVRSAVELLGRIRHDGEGYMAGVRINHDGSDRWIGFIQLAARPGPLPAPEELNSRFARLEDEIGDLRARIVALEKQRVIPRRPAVVRDSVAARDHD